ncbi:MAG: 3-hydroxyacyl-CoA dehydrogenase family protein [Actinobacteria bacterium]|nr:3-hydroxyacyl-CoA dehydrogenase family protein [Actinomycetota bacterium]
MKERLGIVGTGAIAAGLARVAAEHGEVVVWARSPESHSRAVEAVGEEPAVTTDLDALAGCTLVVEAVVEDRDVKSELLARLAAVVDHDAILGSTTSSLSVAELAQASGRPERFAAVHVFNPVERMQLVELAFPDGATGDTRERVRAWVEDIGKTPVEVPDEPGFVVNRLLFPYLFSAVELAERHNLEPSTVDDCMRLGAGHPMGPLALLDFVGLDVAAAIGEELGVAVPERVRQLIDSGALGRKSGRGFYSYAR